MNVTKPTSLLAAGLLAIAFYQPLHAQDVKKTLDPIVVTAGRSRQKLKDVPQKVEVINNKDIAATPALDVTDILKKAAAVNVIQYPGILSGVGIRGFRPQFSGLNQRTLLLINGRPAGTTNLGSIDLNNVDHIEVLKGPASALYGSQAMGGVVNIITPQSTGPVNGKVYADLGSFSTYQLGAQAGGNLSRKMDFDISGTWFDRAADFRIGKGNVFRSMLGSRHALNRYAMKDSVVNDARADGQTRANTEYRYGTGAARLGYQLDSNWRVDVSGSIFSATHVESPGDIFSGEAGAGLKNIARYSTEAAVTGKAGRHELSARAYYADEVSTTFAIRTSTGAVIDTPFISGRSRYQWYGLQLRDGISFHQQKLIIGYDYNNAGSHSVNYTAPVGKAQKESTSTPDAALITNGIYAQGQLSLLNGHLKVNPGIRFDITQYQLKATPGYTQVLGTGSKSNNFVSPSLSAQYGFGGFAVHGSIGRAFITPDASNVAGYQISGQGTGKVVIAQGNPDLKNENSVSEEIGLKYEHRSSGISADITYFSTNVHDRIVAVSAPPAKPDTLNGDVVTAVTNYYNADKSKIRGLEIMAAYDFGAMVNYRYSLRLFTNITKSLRAQDITVGTAKEANIQNIAKANVNYGIEYISAKAISARLTGRYVGTRWDTDFNDPLRPLVQYPAFMTLDVTAGYAFTAQHQVSVAIANVTDENYYEKRGYNMAGRSFSIRYTYRFKAK